MKFLDIGYGLQIFFVDSGVWKVKGGSNIHELKEPSDFWRLYVLLERPYLEVKSIIDNYSFDIKAATPFPYWKVVSAGLASEIDQWAGLALLWFPNLDQDEKKFLNNLLERVVISKNWASQKTRQLASNYIKQQR